MLITLSVTIAVCWETDHLDAVASLFLGTIASAIAETDDNWLGRSKAVLLSLLCFAGAGASVVLLFPHPALFVLGMATSTFALTLLGALGERYALIAQATVALAIYAMIGIDHGGEQPWQGVVLLMIGAAWYGALSILWVLLFANRPVRERLSRLFEELGHYLQLKADLLEPVRQSDLYAIRLALSEQNARVVTALNDVKDVIIARFGRSGRPGMRSGVYFRLYYMAQEFHERASSSHYPYEALTEAFFHSDVLYRCQRLLSLQGLLCAALGKAIQLGRPFVYSEDTSLASDDLYKSLSFLKNRPNAAQRRLLGTLDLLVSNLQTIERRLFEAAQLDTATEQMDMRLSDSSPHTLREMVARLGEQLTPNSILFRHGLRMAIALSAGYLLIHSINTNNGYWILLTTAFVCRPHYDATRLRLIQRILGTLLGLVIAWVLMQLFSNTLLQLVFALLSTLIFILTRTERYMVATTAITAMVLFCFNLIGNGFVLIWPRLFDTLIGCAIAAAAAFLILPDWQGRRLHKICAHVIDTCANYLDKVLVYYRGQPVDDLDYRIARRDMNNADAGLSAALAHMLREPGRYRRNLDTGFRFLALTNTLLGHLSALGVHRAPLADISNTTELEEAGAYIEQELEAISHALAARTAPPMPEAQIEQRLIDTLEAIKESDDRTRHLLATQLTLLLRLLPQLRAAVTALMQPVPAEDIPELATT
ncbi:YccS family putative transporter [Xylella taiwanensis]|uniref:YccS family putative transporter n=1 Tax=Xylella taiwanensis TaxID=1444770 RepID=A0ABS8TYD4_9GAMM|nr:YccS family putative transporter [Xylella taiwanensis]MCD8456732.1 YccS family putative transporter [Xylella taiwanensis]MCD8459141.1 YccS family putative transporter [Xylella taiwanensis]MCD8461966.1 YccS family putative transporter [Xylella taiwanensis]MCD8464231.1 YccS family putative transporter [Xylella taiwanensis]MCD8465786.1 YccS family putative transporter [Xylella taiwanensis]